MRPAKSGRRRGFVVKSNDFKAFCKSTVLIILLLFLTGCWNNRGLSEINLVSAIGLDRSEDGKILVAVQMVEPAAIQSMSPDGGKVESAQPKSTFVDSYETETVFEALRGMLSMADKKLFLSTTQVLILGEKLSQEGIYEVLDFFQRDHEIEYKMDVLVAKGVTPKEILEMETDVDAIPAVYIKGTVENTISRGTVKKTRLIDLIKALCSDCRQPAIGQITKAGEKEVKTEGTAVFKDGKLSGWLDAFETRGLLFAIGQMKSGIVNIPSDGGIIAMEIIRSKGKVDVKMKNNEPALLTVKVELEANVGEYGAKGELDTPEHLHQLEGILGEAVKKEIKKALEKVQIEYASDIFGFGARLHKYHPTYWKKGKDDWNDTFSKLPTDIQVVAKIRRTGTIKNSVKKGG